jgi:uncharacterized SAM-binding protein YcdF (DUF218 family)
MFFILSKIFWMLCSPLTLIGLMIVAGLVFKKLNRLVSAGAVLFVVFGFLPIGPNLIVYLERQYGNPQPVLENVTGIIVLGGVIDGERSDTHQQISLNDYAERITEMIKLSHIYPQARIIFSGGTGAMAQTSSKESEKVHTLLKDLDNNPERFEYEGQSRNTYENMTESIQIANPQAGDTWVLVTSAFHLPRAVGVFKKGGWPIIPYPAGYLENGSYVLHPTFDVLGNFYKLQVATKEIVGIIAYSLTGKL